MRRQIATAAVAAACLIGSAQAQSGEPAPATGASAEAAPDDVAHQPPGAPIEYFPLEAPEGLSSAVAVERRALVHTRQLLPVDRGGAVVGKDSLEAQADQALDNLEAVLRASGSSLAGLVRLNVCALEPEAVEAVRGRLVRRLDPAVRPALSAVLTPLAHRDARLALDAVAVCQREANGVSLIRCETLGGETDAADAAVLPPGGVAYLSGMPAEGGLTVSAVERSMSALCRTLAELNLSPSHVVQLRVFLRPAAGASEVVGSLKKFFPDQQLPPVVFVEWLAPPPVEIELIAELPGGYDPARPIEYYNPADVRPLQIFSRVALVRAPRQIYTSSIVARKPAAGQAQALDVFDQLQTILAAAGGDLRHLAKATYYVSDDDSARGVDRARLWRFDQDRPPAASKVMVHGVGWRQRGVSLDMIAAPARQ